MLTEDCAVEAEDVTGDQGREEAIELRETLRLYGVLLTELSGERSSRKWYCPAFESLRCPAGRIVFPLASSSTLVELFHLGRLIFKVKLLLTSAERDGDESGVRLWLCL